MRPVRYRTFCMAPLSVKLVLKTAVIAAVILNLSVAKPYWETGSALHSASKGWVNLGLALPWPVTHSQPLLRNHCSRSWVPSSEARTDTAACIAQNLDKEGFVHIFCFLEAAEWELQHAEFSYLIMLIIHQHWVYQFWTLIFYILSKCKKNMYIKGTENLWQRLTRAYIMAQGLEVPCCSEKRKQFRNIS